MSDNIIQQLLAPVLMISACGLLCLGQFARYTAILNRLRAFNAERFALLQKIRHVEGGDRKLLEKRLEGLHTQADRVLRHAAVIRYALLSLSACIVFMVVTSLLIGLERLVPAASTIAVVTFVIGLVCVLAGMLAVIAEVSVSLNLVRFEHHNIEMFTGEALAASPAGEEASIS